MKHLRIIHLSDPHFGTVEKPVEEALIRSIKNSKAHLVLITGDITQRARRSQFIEATKFFSELRPLPVLVVPGNHDIALFNIVERLFDPYRGYRKYFLKNLEGRFISESIDVVALNSTSRFRHIQGLLDLKILEDKLQVLKAPFRVVAFHHPTDCRHPVDEKNLLINRIDALKILTKYKVDLVVGGHIHDPLTRLSSFRYPTLERKMILSVAGTCLSTRVRKDSPNSYHVYDFEVGVGLCHARWDFEEGEFVSVEENRFVKSTSGWDAP